MLQIRGTDLIIGMHRLKYEQADEAWLHTLVSPRGLRASGTVFSVNYSCGTPFRFLEMVHAECENGEVGGCRWPADFSGYLDQGIERWTKRLEAFALVSRVVFSQIWTGINGHAFPFPQ